MRAVPDSGPTAGGRAASTIAVLASGVLALSGREIGWGAPVIVLSVGGASLLASGAREGEAPDRARWLTASAIGLAALVAGRMSTPGATISGGAMALTASAAAGVAEEAFFRKLLYDRLLGWGTSAAVAGSAFAFAAVHVPAYGFAAIPLDLVFGLVLAWERSYAGAWTAPALTHAAANVLAFA